MPADQWRIGVIDGSNMSRVEMKSAALQWVTDALDGRAQVFKQSEVSAVSARPRSGRTTDREPRE